MEIVYCDTCGFRIPEKALADGQAIRDGTRTYCEKCRPQAARNPRASSASEIKAHTPRRHTEAVLMPAVPSRPRPASEAGARHELRLTESSQGQQRPMLALFLAGGAGIFLLGAVFFLSGSDGKSERNAKNNSSNSPASSSSFKPAPEINQSSTPSSTANSYSNSKTTSADPGPSYSLTRQDPSGPPSEEKVAQEAFHELTRFDGLAKEDKEGRIERLENFLKKYGDTIVASRALAMLNDLKNPPAAPPVTATPVTAAEPAVKPITNARPGKAKFLKRDDTTSGNWKGVYGKEGYILFAYQAKKAGYCELNVYDLSSLPAYFGALKKSQQRGYCRDPKGDGQRTLQHPTLESRSLTGETGKAMDYTLSFKDEKPHRVSLFFVSGERGTRTQTVELVNGTNVGSLDKKELKSGSFDEGSYLSWEVEGQVIIRIRTKEGAEAVCSAFFFDKPEADSEKVAVNSTDVTPAAPAGLPIDWLKPLADLLKQNNFAGALDWLEQKQRLPSSAELTQAIEQEKSDIQTVLTMRKEALEMLRKRAGNSVSLWKGASAIEGKIIADPQSSDISLKLAGGPEFTFKAESLAAQDVDAIISVKEGADAEDPRKRGLLFLAAGNFAKAKEHFLKTKERVGGELAAPYLDRMEKLEAGEMEPLAQEAWNKAEALFAAKNWKEARQSYEAIRQSSQIKLSPKQAELLQQRLASTESEMSTFFPGLRGVYYHGVEPKEEKEALKRIDPKIDFAFSSGPTKDLGLTFSARWTGRIKCKTGHHTFTTASDDGARLWIDGRLVVDDWGQHPVRRTSGEIDLQAGQHEFKLEYFNGSNIGEIRLYWALKDGFAEELIPSDAFSYASTAADSTTPLPGLQATYYRGMEIKEDQVVLRRIDPKIDFNWEEGAPSKEVPDNYFSARWTGKIKVTKAGRYTFATYSNDGVRLFIDGKPIVENWTPHDVKRDAGDLDLTAGFHEFRLEYYEQAGTAICRLFWALKDGFAEEVIPAEALFHTGLPGEGTVKAPPIDLKKVFKATPQIQADGSAVLTWTTPQAAAFQDDWLLSDPLKRKPGEFATYHVAPGIMLKLKGKGGDFWDNTRRNGVVLTPKNCKPTRFRLELAYTITKESSGGYCPGIGLWDGGLQALTFGPLSKIGGNLGGYASFTKGSINLPSGPINDKDGKLQLAVNCNGSKCATFYRGSTETKEEAWIKIHELDVPEGMHPAITPWTWDEGVIEFIIHSVRLVIYADDPIRQGGTVSANPGTGAAAGAATYLSDLQETEVKVGYYDFGKKGNLAGTGGRITVSGVESPHGLFMVPPDNGASHVAYTLGRQFKMFNAAAAIDDNRHNSTSFLTFKVLGDGKVLWTSKPMQVSKQPQECAVSVAGVEKLELEVHCPGEKAGAYAVWLEPRLSK